jgi:hypothetical protein
MTTQWHCTYAGHIIKTNKPSIDNYIAGVADGQGLRNSQAGNHCPFCGAGEIVADN